MFVQMQFMDMRGPEKALLIPPSHHPDQQAHSRDAGRGQRPAARSMIGIESGGQTESNADCGPPAWSVSSQFLIDSEASLKGRRGAAQRRARAPR